MDKKYDILYLIKNPSCWQIAVVYGKSNKTVQDMVARVGIEK